MAEFSLMDKEYFHMYVNGKVKNKNGDVKPFSSLISADELGYVTEHTGDYDQNSFMFALVGSCKNVEELKTKIKALYRGRQFDSIDDITLCVHERYNPDYQMPSYIDSLDGYSFVPLMFSEAYNPSKEYIDGNKVTEVQVVDGLSHINNPYNIIRDTFYRLMERKKELIKYPEYRTYYHTIISSARTFFNSIIKTKLNGLKEHRANTIKLMIDEAMKLYPYLQFEYDEYEREYYEVYTNNLGQRCREKFEDTDYYDFLYLDNEEEMQKYYQGLSDKAKKLSQQIENEKKKLSEFTSISDDEEFIFAVLNNEQVLFKNSGLRGNSIKFYVYLAQFANQIKVQEIKRLLFNKEKEDKMPDVRDSRKFRSLYNLDDALYEIASRGSVSDVIEYASRFNKEKSYEKEETFFRSLLPFEEDLYRNTDLWNKYHEDDASEINQDKASNYDVNSFERVIENNQTSRL